MKDYVILRHGLICLGTLSLVMRDHVQEDLLEKQPALICNDGLELELDDTNNINEDTIYVTGFTVRWG